ncbi:hypothetical protein OF83DRAFT_1241998 [Amylostereum chailletii]|nr:hypothetical protein OF83DRAFT_1241998 [Amylostereum chailletii]
MRFAHLAPFALFAAVQAHFTLNFPDPRGAFVEDDEPTFCDGYAHASSNRSSFPLSGGFVKITSEHPSWTLGVLLSTQSDPNSFEAFRSNGNDQLARNYASGSGEGDFCIPLDLSSAGISGVQNAANVTIQLVFNGGDGSLFQCADLIISDSFTTNESCSNGTDSSSSSTASSTASGTSAAASSSASASASSSSSGAVHVSSAGFFAPALLGTVGALLAL